MEKYWSRFQKTYDENQEYVAGIDLLQAVEHRIWELPDFGNVLELGCGTGVFTKIISEKAAHITATDLSTELLAVTKARFKNAGNVTTHVENCMNISSPSETFDTIFMANVLHVIENPERALDEIHRVLRKNGLLVLTSFTAHGMTTWQTIKMVFRFIKAWGKPPKYTHKFSPEDLTALAEAAGFSMKSCELIGHNTKSIFMVANKK